MNVALIFLLITLFYEEKKMQKMPLAKKLSYFFNRLSRKDVMTSRLFMQTKVVDVGDEFNPRRIVGSMEVYHFCWADAQPVPGEKGRYALTLHDYERNQNWGVSGDRGYLKTQVNTRSSENPYFTREEAEAAIRTYEEKTIKESSTIVVSHAPYSLSQFSIHRDGNKPKFRN